MTSHLGSPNGLIDWPDPYFRLQRLGRGMWSQSLTLPLYCRSRLGCQIKMTPELNNIVVAVPEETRDVRG